MRKLYYIPIVHTPEDLGSYLEPVKRAYIAKHGLLKWNEHLRAVSELWQKIREAITVLPLDYTDYAKVRIYQDGLPVCNRELEIVEKLAQDGNRNYQLLFELVKKGAKIMGSEDPKLLFEERERLIKRQVSDVGGQVLGEKDSPNTQYPTPNTQYDELMERRDEYIAQRIASTLKDDEIGLLFIGALHRVVERLPKDIEVIQVPKSNRGV